MPNRIAIYAHRGWIGSKIVKALAESPASVKILCRPGSSVAGLPSNVSAANVDITDQADLIAALKDIDILISLVGHAGIRSQHHLVEAIPKTEVQLFVPSDLAVRYAGQGLGIDLIRAKLEVEEHAKRLAVKTTTVLTGNLAEFALGTPAMGVDLLNNRIIFTGDSASQPLNLCTRSYVAAAYVSMFADTPIEILENRTLSLSELRPTGYEIQQALTTKFGVPPAQRTIPIERVSIQVDEMIKNGDPGALAWYTRKNWGNGDQLKFLGTDFWEVEGYTKATVKDLLVEEKLEEYRPLPKEFLDILYVDYADCV
ncbi:hypothetical protein ASPBRDRAFT_76782 [Aspergillus brasiliensis CBS 101740]|uniref:NmrA-like domain-containing protein n=1 Tax=Aspergillus brasiliensis (strain CBS 101740 / IMI 381727 / IBT 21946) TaxID=767769 RepID=A0A1L9UF15_ASPBC|nr:hypothetical protein ASPBRDRAFT_76782 [Aspergillus brasiliensis CBS 101740]